MNIHETAIMWQSTSRRNYKVVQLCKEDGELSHAMHYQEQHRVNSQKARYTLSNMLDRAKREKYQHRRSLVSGHIL